jgi:hypothetical protein
MSPDTTLRLIASAALAAIIKGGVALTGHSIHLVWAVLIALVVVYGGWLILDGDAIE